MRYLLLLAALAASAAANLEINLSKRDATLNSTSQLLHLNLTPHLEHLAPPPATSRSVSPDAPEETSPADANPLALLREAGEEEPFAAQWQQPESCVLGVAAEPCAIMDVRRRCGSAAPIGIDPARNYTLRKARYSLVGSNFSIEVCIQDKDGNYMPLNGTNIAAFSDVLVQHGCKSRQGGWVRWAAGWLGAGIFGYVVTMVMDNLPIWGMFR